SAATYPLAIAAITGGKITCSAVGKGSVQGDAAFCHLLGKMGCTVTQDDNETTVTGPPAGQLKGLGDIDMETMTDAFMTAAVLAAVATGKPPTPESLMGVFEISTVLLLSTCVTRILGVANQRVKECNRIAVMVSELGKCGVKCGELDDGIEIHGCGGVKNMGGATIVCHDDHRIAMSFGVLGCLLPGLVITEKECVEKTYPEYWDHLRLTLGATLQAADSHPEDALASAVRNPSEAHCILIGMRGAGKTTMGRELARRMRRPFLDLDDLAIEKQPGKHQP
ncbi:RNA 3'-terminal phosphate cyclase/enolpyruvate transferase, partial [Baffinella frigidus]